jgi:membrane protease YdiL (CAAX protease family)
MTDLLATGNVGRRRMRIAGQMLGSLLLGGVAILGSILIFRQGMLPLIEAAFHPGPELLSVFRRVGILLTAVTSYWAFVHWHEKRKAAELHLRPIQLMLGGASGAALVALPMAVLFALGVYELVLFRDVSPALLGVAALIGIAAVLEELIYRCLLFRVVERTWGTKVALAVQAVVFALMHLGNVEQGGARDVVTMLIAVTLAGLLWAAVFVLTRNLWAAAANHAAWNFTILLAGVPLSGIEDWRKLAPLESRFTGPDWLTGGMFGPESSLLVIVSTTVAVVLLLRAARRRGRFFVPVA